MDESKRNIKMMEDLNQMVWHKQGRGDVVRQILPFKWPAEHLYIHRAS